MTVSLVAVFIPLLFLGGILGRLFREFAVTISIAILVSGFVSLTLTPMLCSRFLTAQGARSESAIGRPLEAGFQLVLRFYDRSLGFVLKHRFVTLILTFASLAATIYAFQAIPKGFFP